METKKDNLKKVKDNQADEPPLSETESKNASDDALPSETAEKSKEKAKSEKPKKKKGKKVPWPVKSLIITLILSSGFNILSELVVANLTLKTIFIAYILILVIVLISIIADIIGVAATSCDIQPFLAMAARKVKGAKIAKNRDVVNSVCSDIIGDICGIISGACGAAIITVMAISDSKINLIASVVCSTVIAALMITGKAMGKKLGLNKASQIVLGVAKVLSVFSKN